MLQFRALFCRPGAVVLVHNRSSAFKSKSEFLSWKRHMSVVAVSSPLCHFVSLFQHSSPDFAWESSTAMLHGFTVFHSFSTRPVSSNQAVVFFLWLRLTHAMLRNMSHKFSISWKTKRTCYGHHGRETLQTRNRSSNKRKLSRGEESTETKSRRQTNSWKEHTDGMGMKETCQGLMKGSGGMPGMQEKHGETHGNWDLKGMKNRRYKQSQKGSKGKAAAF